MLRRKWFVAVLAIGVLGGCSSLGKVDVSVTNTEGEALTVKDVQVHPDKDLNVEIQVIVDTKGE